MSIKVKPAFKFLYYSPVIILIFFITGRTFTYDEAIILGFTDLQYYYQIAKNLFNVQELRGIPLHHLERWAFHNISGYISLIFKVDLWTIYKMIVIICIIVLVILINLLKCSEINKIAIFIFMLFNPYTFRLYWAAPGTINDCIYYTSIVGFILSIIDKRVYLFVSSIIIASLARQTIILCLPILLILYVNNKLSRKLFILGTSLIIVFYIGNSQFSKYIFNIDSGDGYVSSHIFNYYEWFMGSISFEEIFAFYGRYAIIIILIMPLLLLTNKSIISNNKIYLLSFFIMQSQPLLISGPMTGGNIQRLCAFAYPLMIPLLLKETEAKIVLLFSLLVFMYSLHHNYTEMALIPSARYIYLLFVMISGLISLVYYIKLKK